MKHLCVPLQLGMGLLAAMAGNANRTKVSRDALGNWVYEQDLPRQLPVQLQPRHVDHVGLLAPELRHVDHIDLFTAQDKRALDVAILADVNRDGKSSFYQTMMLSHLMREKNVQIVHVKSPVPYVHKLQYIGANERRQFLARLGLDV